jgi:hypothetical protein
MRSHVNFGNSDFDIIGTKTFNLTLTSQVKLVTMTPIIIRIPQSTYQGYDIKLKHPFKRLYLSILAMWIYT